MKDFMWFIIELCVAIVLAFIMTGLVLEVIAVKVIGGIPVFVKAAGHPVADEVHIFHRLATALDKGR